MEGREKRKVTYLAGEHARRNGVDANLGAHKRRRKHPAQMRRRRLGARIRKLATAATLHVSRDTAHVDDRARVAGRDVLALGQQRQEGHAHPEDAADIGLESVSPVLLFRFEEVLGDGFGGFPVGFASGREFCVVVAGDAGVVDEELNAFGFLFGELFVETGDVGLVARSESA
jgi:hypothetical protein